MTQIPRSIARFSMRISTVLPWFLLAAVCFTGLPALPALAAGAEHTLEIEIRPPSGESGSLAIDLTFESRGAVPGIVEVVEEWGGSSFEAGIIQEARVADAGGGEWRQLEVAEAPHAWRLEHVAGERLHLRYELPINTFHRGTDGDSYYKPIVTENLVHLIGHQALLLPESWPDDAKLAVTLTWRGLAKEASAVSSFGMGPGPHRFETIKEGLRRGLFVTGRGQLFQGSGTDPVHVFVADGPWRFAPQELAQMAQEIVPAERSFFAERAAGPFLITAIPIGPEEPEHLNYGGTGLEKAFAIFLVPVLEMDEDGREGLHYLLAHEKAHTWIGGRIASGEEPETGGYWFSEGFTDYYTPRLLYRAGLMEPEQVVEEWNSYLRRYFLSPAAEASNQRITDGFWTDRDLQQLAYQRGAAVTFFLDQTRRRRTQGEARLDDWLLAELAKARREDRIRKLTNAELRDLLTPGWTEEEIATAFSTLIDGRPLALPPDLLAPCAKLVWRDETPFELGFELDSSTGEILSVDEGTKAWAAGLRAGQELAGWSIRYGDPTREIEVSRKTENGSEKIRFLPTGAKRPVPSYEIENANACSDLM